MKLKKKRINWCNERVLLSDVLPYELPVTFSNRRFVNFIKKNGVRLEEHFLRWDKADSVLEPLLKILFAIPENKTVANREIKIDNTRTIPFNYQIAHKEDDFRVLTVVHPLNQLAVVEFYEKYKELILYYCSISPFSIRKPHRIARFVYYKDRTHIERLAHDHEHKSAEEYDKEYENLKTYFSYKEISNVYKFYESYKYHRCEKKYSKLFKFDVSKCFDSIYTHSLSWALLNKEIVKEKIDPSKRTFPGRFDALMQNLNYGETNGIVIGPEFSRIFAEMILQRIDLDVMNALEKNGVKFKVDYEIFRYVDDFFVFYNDDQIKEQILSAYRIQLKDYKLYLNDSKTALFENPIITGITMAKQKITDLLNSNLNFKKLKQSIETNEEEGKEEAQEARYAFYLSSNKLITRFKTILKETEVPYKDILNYTLACIDRKIIKLIKLYNAMENKDEQELPVTKAIIEVLEFSFFLYSVSPRVNTTIKLCMILSKLTKLTKVKGNFNHDHKHLILKKIYDDIALILTKNKNSKFIQIETLYLLIALKELGREYRLDESLLCKYLCINDADGDIKFNYDLNYFSITVLLFYIEKKPRYEKIRAALLQQIKKRYTDVPVENRRKTAELNLMFFDILSSPHLEEDFKKEIMGLYGIEDSSIQNDLILQRENCFTQWKDFDFAKALEAKKSQEVY